MYSALLMLFDVLARSPSSLLRVIIVQLKEGRELSKGERSLNGRPFYGKMEER